MSEMTERGILYCRRLVIVTHANTNLLVASSLIHWIIIRM